MNKWIGISLGSLIGISHIGMIGMLATRTNSRLPDLNIPTGDYASYEADVERMVIGLVIEQMILKLCSPLKILKLKVDS